MTLPNRTSARGVSLVARSRSTSRTAANLRPRRTVRERGDDRLVHGKRQERLEILLPDEHHDAQSSSVGPMRIPHPIPGMSGHHRSRAELADFSDVAVESRRAADQLRRYKVGRRCIVRDLTQPNRNEHHNRAPRNSRNSSRTASGRTSGYIVLVDPPRHSSSDPPSGHHVDQPSSCRSHEPDLSRSADYPRQYQDQK